VYNFLVVFHPTALHLFPCSKTCRNLHIPASFALLHDISTTLEAVIFIGSLAVSTNISFIYSDLSFTFIQNFIWTANAISFTTYTYLAPSTYLHFIRPSKIIYIAVTSPHNFFSTLFSINVTTRHAFIAPFVLLFFSKICVLLFIALTICHEFVPSNLNVVIRINTLCLARK